jgi:acyl carrier protein
MDAADIELFLRERFASEVGVDIARIDASSPMVSYGLDSLTIAAISGELEDRLQIRLEPSVLYDNPSIRALALHLAKLATART